MLSSQSLRVRKCSHDLLEVRRHRQYRSISSVVFSIFTLIEMRSVRHFRLNKRILEHTKRVYCRICIAGPNPSFDISSYLYHSTANSLFLIPIWSQHHWSISVLLYTGSELAKTNSTETKRLKSYHFHMLCQVAAQKVFHDSPNGERAPISNTNSELSHYNVIHWTEFV